MASAPATISEAFCEADELPCASANRYPAGTEVSAVEAETAAIGFDLGEEAGEVACGQATLEGETSAQGLDTDLDISSAAFASCEELPTSAACAVSAENLPYTGSYVWSDGLGALELEDGGEGEPGWRVQCEETGVDCTYSPESSFDLQGGSPATLAASKVQLDAIPNAAGGCPGTDPKLSAVYEIEAPSPLHFTGADRYNTRRDGSSNNANFHLDGIDDERVDADIAVFSNGFPAPAELTDIDLVHRVDCVNPNPLREWEDPAYEAPDPEDPDWRPNERLNETGKVAPYGCLEGGGESTVEPGEPFGGEYGPDGARFAAEIDGTDGLGGIAPGARIWSVRAYPGSGNIGDYRNPKSFPEHPGYDPEAPEWLPELGTEHLVAALDWVADHADEIEVAYMRLGCAAEDFPPQLIEHLEAEFPDFLAAFHTPMNVCDDMIVREAIDDLIDKGVVIVLGAGEWDFDVKYLTPQSDPDVIATSAVDDADGLPGGLAGGEGPCAAEDDELHDDRPSLASASNFGAGAGIAVPICLGDTGMASGKLAGTLAAVASQCDPSTRADVEAITGVLRAAGDTGSIEEGGWEDTSEDGFKEPLLNLNDESLFDPAMVGEEQAPVDCESLLYEPVPAHIPLVEAEAHPATLVGEGTASLSTPSGSIVCDDARLEGELSEASASLDLEAEHSVCVLTGETQRPADVFMNSCHYTLDVQNQGPPYVGSLGVACSEEGDAIEYKVYLGESKGIVLCTVEVGPQAGLEGVELATLGVNDERAIELEAQAEGVEYEQSGSCGETSGGDGVLDVGVILLGEDEAEERQGVYLAGQEVQGVFLEGKESEEEAVHPRIAAEAHPATLVGEGTASLSTPSGSIVCDDARLEGELSEASASLDLEAEHSVCVLTGETQRPADVFMNSCHYTLDVQNQGPPYVGSLGVACSEEGDAIEYKVYLGESKGIVLCTVEVGPQAGLEGVELATLGVNDERAIELEAQAEGVEYEQSGSCGETSGGDGVLDVGVTLVGVG